MGLRYTQPKPKLFTKQSAQTSILHIICDNYKTTLYVVYYQQRLNFKHVLTIMLVPLIFCDPLSNDSRVLNKRLTENCALLSFSAAACGTWSNSFLETCDLVTCAFYSRMLAPNQLNLQLRNGQCLRSLTNERRVTIYLKLASSCVCVCTVRT